MIDLTDIKNYFPVELHGFERFMIREYLQYKTLEIIFESPYSGKLAFLGGTALRIVHNNNRFSEDLDFDNLGLVKTEFEQMISYLSRKLLAEGLVVEAKNTYHMAYHSYLKFPGLLKKMRLSGHYEEKLTLRIDMEPQHFDFSPDWRLINKFDVFTQIAVTPLPLLLSQKLFALINRKRNKGRDFHDIAFLLSKNIKPNYNYLKAKLDISNANQLKKQLNYSLQSIDLNEMVDDVNPFLLNPGDSKRIMLFRELIEQSEF